MATPKITQDWIELLQSLVAHKVDFMIVGAFALAFHGHPRYTGDLDIFFSADHSNAENLYAALKEFGAPVSSLKVEDFEDVGVTFTFGVPPSRVDMLNWLSGVGWEEARASSVEGDFSGVTVRYIGTETYIKNKRASGRPQDLADIDHIERLN